MKKVTWLVCVALVAFATNASASLVTSRALLGGTDFIDWGQFGTPGTVVGPAAGATDGGLAFTVTDADNSMARVDQSSAWAGNFAPSDELMWTGGAIETGALLSIDFAGLVGAVGAQIQSVYYGSFTATLSVFDSLNNLLETQDLLGNSSGSDDNSAIFIGISRGSSDIARAQFQVTGIGLPSNEFAINQVDIGGGSGSVPAPATLALIGLGLAGIGRMRKKAKTV